MIRAISQGEGERYAVLIEKLEKESDFLLYGADEREWSAEQVNRVIKTMNDQTNSTIFVAEKDGQFIGHVTVFGGGAKCNAHVGKVTTGVFENFHGQGVAYSLFQQLEEWAVVHQVTRLEMSVMVHNERAVKFYERVGFEKEGTKRQSLFVQGLPVDEYVMAKILA